MKYRVHFISGVEVDDPDPQSTQKKFIVKAGDDFFEEHTAATLKDKLANCGIEADSDVDIVDIDLMLRAGKTTIVGKKADGVIRVYFMPDDDIWRE